MSEPRDPAKPTILMMTDSPLRHTGQAVVMREVALGLAKLNKYNIVVAGWGYDGEPHPYPFTMVKASPRDFGKTPTVEGGTDNLEGIINQVKPDFLWTIGDSWMFDYVCDMKNRASFQWIAYSPIDGEPIPKHWTPWLRNPQRLVMETEYGFNMVRKFDPSIDHRWIYHGCHTGKYYPLPAEARLALKKEIRYLKITGENNLTHATGLDEGDFVVGTLARNQLRKNFDRNIKAFSIFAKDKPNAKLWIHAAPIDLGYNLVQLAYFFGVQDKVIFSIRATTRNGLSEEDMNRVINMWDVHFLPTQGEGFGIPILETMSAGVPQAVTDYTSHVEFARKGGLMIPVDPDDDFVMGLPQPILRAFPKPSLCAKALQTLYSDVALRKQLSLSARETALKMTWEATIPQWDKVIQELVLAAKAGVSTGTKKAGAGKA